MAGRAGRRCSAFDRGLVTCMHAADVPQLRRALSTPATALATPAAGLFPEFDQLEAFAGKMLGASFADTLQQCAPLCLKVAWAERMRCIYVYCSDHVSTLA